VLTTIRRQRNDGLRKICNCSLRSWPRCEHPWYFSFKPKGKPRVRVSLDRYKGEHVALLEDAKTIAAELRTAVANDTYPPQAQSSRESAPAVTYQIAAERWLAHVPLLRGKNRGNARSYNDRHKIDAICAFVPAGRTHSIGTHEAASVTEDMFEEFIAHMRGKGRSPATTGKHVQTIQAVDRWMLKKGYRTKSALSGESAVLTVGKSAKRSRRLVPDALDAAGKVVTEGEERRLLAVAAPSLQRLIIAALETGCRLGELQGLKWGDVDLGRGEFTVRGASNKTGASRTLPISPRLRAVLELLRIGPMGTNRPADHFVFGDAIGGRPGNPRKAWETAVLKSHGVEPTWTGNKGFSDAARAALRSIDLHFHDLRHEAGSRMLEAGWPLHHIQRMLGHADLKMTSIYLNVERVGLQESMRRFGTTPWQSVANAPVVEHRHDGHEPSVTSAQDTIN